MLLLSIPSFNLKASYHLKTDCMQAIFLRKGGGKNDSECTVVGTKSREKNSTTEKKKNSRNPEVSILPLPK